MPWTRTRPARRLRQQRRIDPGIAGVVASVGAGARYPDPVHLVLRQTERAGDPVAREMRLLRAGPQSGAVDLRVDDGAGRAHAGMRLERPLVFRFDDPRADERAPMSGRSRFAAIGRQPGRRTAQIVGKSDPTPRSDTG